MVDKRSVFCLLLGLMLSVGIWVAVPYNNFALNNSFICDSYLPEVVVLFMFVLVLGVNPLLHRWAPAAALEQKHLALVCGIMLFAAILPSNGLMRFFPHGLAMNTQQINQSSQLAPAIRDSGLPPSLFPDPIENGHETPAARQFNDELDPGKTIPWSAWVPVFASWGVFIVAFWVLMVGMGLMVFPQWMKVERLAFPLLKVYHAMLGSNEPGKSFPPVFRSRLFWIGCGTVFVIHSMNGLNIFTSGSFPGFPVKWNLSPVLTEGVWRYLPGFLKNSRIYFLFVGLAFFMPNRYCFSIWFTVLACGLFNMYATIYMPTFDNSFYYDQGAGAIIAMAAGIIWLGREHYRRVFLSALGVKGLSGQQPNDALAGRMFLVGGVVMFGWFLWAGVGPLWAILFVALAIITMLVVTRIVAETGITYVWIIPFTASRFIGLLPGKWLTVAVAFLQEAQYILVNRASAISAAAITLFAVGLNPKSTPKDQRNMAGIGIAVLVIGFIVCGAVHLNMAYHFSASLDGVNSPVAGRGAQLTSLNPVSNVLAGRESDFDAAQAGSIAWGAALGGVLLIMCGRFPAWPLHPIGLIFVHSSIGLRLFMSLFIGWLIKTVLVQVGGARAYHLTMPLFLGFIIGEILANAIWILVPAMQILFGVDPADVQRMVIFQYT